MDEIGAYVRSPGWWFTAIFAGGIVGLVGSLAAAYLKRPVDRALGSISDRWRARTEAERGRVEFMIGFLTSGTIERRLAFRMRAYAQEARARYYTLVSLLFMAIGTAVGAARIDRALSGVLFFGALVTMWFSWRARSETDLLRHILLEAESRLE